MAPARPLYFIIIDICKIEIIDASEIEDRQQVESRDIRLLSRDQIEVCQSCLVVSLSCVKSQHHTASSQSQHEMSCSFLNGLLHVPEHFCISSLRFSSEWSESSEHDICCKQW